MTELLRISGRRQTPVLVHDGPVLLDSAAILRYLDANFPETPKLYHGTLVEPWRIDDWEIFAHGELAEPVMTVVHTRVAGDQVSALTLSACQAAFEAAVEKYDGVGRR